MAEVAKKYQDELKKLKEYVKQSQEYFRPNYKSYYADQKFVFETSLSDEDKAVLTTLKKPIVEVNIIEAYISRLCGEFAKQEPSIKVGSEDGFNIHPAIIDVVEGHLRHIFYEAHKNGTQYAAYRNCLSGGFDVFKVWTDYINPMSFDQTIKFDRVFDPTLTGFDPLARKQSKSDGRYCYELFPKSKEEFVEEYPEIDISKIKFSRNIEGFNWSYQNEKEEILLICDFWKRKKKRIKIVNVVDPLARGGKVMTWDDYQDLLEQYQMEGRIEQPPAIIGKPRWTEKETICRYRFIQTEVIEYAETDYPGLPLIFVDGNSVNIRNDVNGASRQITRSYIKQARDPQRILNFTFQTLANELENLVQHKFMVAKESIPTEQDYVDMYTNLQQQATIVYNAFAESDPEKPLPPPAPVPRVPAPPEVTGSIGILSGIMQNVLGNFDTDLARMPTDALSGIAIENSSTLSNAAAMPYIVNYMQAYTDVAQNMLALFPKYILNSRTIPVRGIDGQVQHVNVNQPGTVDINFPENSLHVKVEASVNFEMQKSKSLNAMLMLMGKSPLFEKMMNTPIPGKNGVTSGLRVLLDNFDVRGIEHLKDMSDKFMQFTAQQMQQQQNQPNPLLLKAQADQARVQMEGKKIDQEGVRMETEAQLKAEELQIKKMEANTDLIQVMGELKADQEEMSVEKMKAHAEIFSKAADLTLQHRDMDHQHTHNATSLHHDILGTLLGHEQAKMAHKSKKETKNA